MGKSESVRVSSTLRFAALNKMPATPSTGSFEPSKFLQVSIIAGIWFGDQGAKVKFSPRPMIPSRYDLFYVRRKSPLDDLVDGEILTVQ